MPIAPNDKKRTAIAAVRSLSLHALLLTTLLMMSACQHIQLVDNPLPITSTAKNPTDNPPQDTSIPTNPQKTPFFLLEDWF